MKYEVQVPDWDYWGRMGKARIIDALLLTVNVDPKWFDQDPESEQEQLALEELNVELDRRLDITMSRLSEFAGVVALYADRVSEESVIDLPAFRHWAAGVWPNVPEQFRLIQDSAPADMTKEVSGKSRSTVAKIIGGLLIKGHGIDIHADRIEGLGDVMKDLESLGAGVSENALREWIKLAKEQIEPQKKAQ